MERISNLDEALIAIENLKSHIRDKEREISFLYNIIKIKNDEIMELRCLIYTYNDKDVLADLYGRMNEEKG